MSGYMATAQSNDWNTPQSVVDAIGALWSSIDLDPCSNETSIVPATRKVSLPEDGLALPWQGKVFVNPPFTDMKLWMGKCVREAYRADIILLAPSRTDTQAWHRTIPTAQAVCFWKGRLKFIGAPASCPFPTAFIYWGKNVEGFTYAFGPYGLVLPIPREVP